MTLSTTTLSLAIINMTLRINDAQYNYTQSDNIKHDTQDK
jgi:hypothetical protein